MSRTWAKVVYGPHDGGLDDGVVRGWYVRLRSDMLYHGSPRGLAHIYLSQSLRTRGHAKRAAEMWARRLGNIPVESEEVKT